MTKGDRNALQLAIERCRAVDADRDQQISAMLMERPWREVAEFAAYSCQMDSLRLKPWELPPCAVDVNDREHRQAAKLLTQMLAVGLSRYEPDPVQALSEP